MTFPGIWPDRRVREVIGRGSALRVRPVDPPSGLWAVHNAKIDIFVDFIGKLNAEGLFAAMKNARL